MLLHSVANDRETDLTPLPPDFAVMVCPWCVSFSAVTIPEMTLISDLDLPMIEDTWIQENT